MKVLKTGVEQLETFSSEYANNISFCWGSRVTICCLCRNPRSETNRIQPKRCRQLSWHQFRSTGTRVRVSCALSVCVLCRATNRHQGSVYSPHSFCPFLPANMAEEEVGALAVEDGSGTCKAGFACDDASRVEFPSSGTDQEVSHVSDDVHSKRSVSTSKSLIEYAIVTNKRCEVTIPHPEELFEELYTLSDGVTAAVSDAWLSGDSLASACLTEVEVVAAGVTVKGETDEEECPVKKRRKTIPAPAVKDWFLKRCCRARSRTFVHRRRASLAAPLYLQLIFRGQDGCMQTESRRRVRSGRTVT